MCLPLGISISLLANTLAVVIAPYYTIVVVAIVVIVPIVVAVTFELSVQLLAACK